METASALANSLLDERLIACANIIPAMRSIYEWQGERGDSTETGMLLKTDSALLERLASRLAELHPYDQPAILAWRCDAASRETAAWLGALAR